jgi:hypothetical protein
VKASTVPDIGGIEPDGSRLVEQRPVVGVKDPAPAEALEAVGLDDERQVGEAPVRADGRL